MKDENAVVQTFVHEAFGEIRTVDIDGEIWFVGKDVATALGYTNPQKAIRDHVDEEDKRTERIVHPLGGAQDTVIINESGLYSLILSSNLPKAKEFKHWVTSEVLPSIRKTGEYKVNNSADDKLSLKMRLDYLIKIAELAPTDKFKEEILKRAAYLIDGKGNVAATLQNHKRKKTRKYQFLSREQIAEIRRLYHKENMQIRDIAKLFNIANGTVWNALHQDPA